METQIESTEKQKKKDAQKTGGLLFTGCMFIGMAAGWYFGHFTICMFTGMGLGFIMMAVVTASQASKR